MALEHPTDVASMTNDLERGIVDVIELGCADRDSDKASNFTGYLHYYEIVWEGLSRATLEITDAQQLPSVFDEKLRQQIDADPEHNEADRIVAKSLVSGLRKWGHTVLELEAQS